jgi:4-hydroxy-tetrahydrodipicolinate synthase
MKISGVWLPIVTPFWHNEVDYDTYKKLTEFYISKKIDGIIPLGTTGEVSTIEDDEYEKIIEVTAECVRQRVPIFVGCGGNNTSKVVKQIKIVEKYNVQGILSVGPYYNRPDQNGIYQHFLKISESTNLDIVIYNIPHRTGRNIENETVYKMAELKNVVGIKDSCGDIKQSMDLLLNKPKGFSVMTGEDSLYYTNLVSGGDGGILAAAHYQCEKYIEIFRKIHENDHKSALLIWKELVQVISLLFEEPNPAPVKYLLFLEKLLRSHETRLPIVEVSNGLQEKLHNLFRK